MSDYNNSFNQIVEKVENFLSFDQIYEAETGYVFKKKQGPCPFCGSGTGNHKGSDGAFTFYAGSNIAKCYSCGEAAGIVKLVMHLHRFEYKEAIEYIGANYCGIVVDTIHELYQQQQPKKTIELSERKRLSIEDQKAEEEDRKSKFEYIKGLILDVKDLKNSTEYLQSRGIKTDELPENTYYQAAAYQNLPEGVVFFDTEMRCLNKRYLNNNLPEGVKKAFTYGEMLNSVFDKTFRSENSDILITEGVINAMSLFQCGKSAIAFFATTNYISDVDKFKTYFNDKDVIIAFDGDKAGQKSAIKQADFILNSFSIRSLSVLIFPEKLDANDLLQQGTLESYIGIKYHYVELTRELIDTELVKIKADEKNYHPKLLPNYYYNRPAANEEKDGTWKADKADVVPDEIIKQFRGSNMLDDSIFKKYEITFVNELTVFEKKTAHVFKSVPEMPIFIIRIADGFIIIWRPKKSSQFAEFEFKGGKRDDVKLFGLSEVEAAYEAIGVVEDSKANTSVKLERVSIAYNLRDFLNLAAVDENPVYNFNGKYSYDDIETLEGYADSIYQVPTADRACQTMAMRTGLKFIDIRTFHIPQLNGAVYKSISDFLSYYQEPRIFKKQLNTALPYKFWDYEKNDYELNIIKLRNFLSANGYYTYKALQEKEGYMYIKIDGRIVSYMDKDTFSRHISSFIDNYLERRGENVKLRNKVSISARFSENNLSGIREIQLDFENSGKNFQNWFFSDGTMWTVSLSGIRRHSQKDLQKYVWEEDLLKFPSEVRPAPFKIKYRPEYLKELKEMEEMDRSNPMYYHKKMSIAGMKNTEKYDIEIIDRSNYFLQFLFLTSHAYYEKVEMKGIEIKPTDFFDKLDTVLTPEEISEIKLHLINKLTWLGYMMKDYKSMSDDFGLAILDAIDNEDSLKRKGAAGGGKSIITKAIKQVKRTLILKAEKEDWCEDKHRYENYNGERVIVADDMHLKSRIGNMLTDFSEGIEVNPKHKRPRKIPFTESPKIIVTRNYIDDEGERVDRRLGRMFVFPFFHDNKGGRHKDRRRPNDYFGRMLFQDDTEEDKSKLVNLFAYCYMSNLKYGEVNPPMFDMEKFRMMNRIGEPLIEFLDLFFENGQGFGYIDRVPFFTEFKERMRNNMTPYQRTNVYSSSQKFKNLVELYCELRGYIFNPEEEINDKKRGRIIQKSKTQTNDKGESISTEHFYIMPKDTTDVNVESIKESIAELKKTAEQMAFGFEEDGGGELPF